MMGCAWVMPSSQVPGMLSVSLFLVLARRVATFAHLVFSRRLFSSDVFTSCDADAAYPPGVYPVGEAGSGTTCKFFFPLFPLFTPSASVLLQVLLRVEFESLTSRPLFTPLLSSHLRSAIHWLVLNPDQERTRRCRRGISSRTNSRADLLIFLPPQVSGPTLLPLEHTPLDTPVSLFARLHRTVKKSSSPLLVLL